MHRIDQCPSKVSGFHAAQRFFSTQLYLSGPGLGHLTEPFCAYPGSIRLHLLSYQLTHCVVQHLHNSAFGSAILTCIHGARATGSIGRVPSGVSTSCTRRPPPPSTSCTRTALSGLPCARVSLTSRQSAQDHLVSARQSAQDHLVSALLRLKCLSTTSRILWRVGWRRG